MNFFFHEMKNAILTLRKEENEKNRYQRRN